MSFSEHITAAIQAHEEVVEENARLKADIVTGDTVIEGQRQTIAELEEEIRKLKAEPVPPPPPPPPPPPEPQPTPTGTPPAILNERFANGVDWDRYFSDDGGGVAAPPARFVPTPEGLKVIWIAGNPSGTRRSELGLREKLGRASGDEWWELEGGVRRDPVNSIRWYAIDFVIPQGYVLDDSTKDQKRVLWQAHQDGGGNPPLSLELRNGTFRLVRSVGTEREHILNPNGTPYPGIPCAKGVRHRLIVHAHWHPTTGYIETWFDALRVPKMTRKTCYSGDGLNIKCGSYQPGYDGFTAGYKLEHLIRWFAIGNETNKLEDFLVT